MYLNTLTSKFKRIGLVLSLVLGFMLLSSASVQAQYRDRDYGRNRSSRSYENQMYRVAQDYGYRDGINKGAEDARDRDRYNPERSNEYKKATNGYDSDYRNKEGYKQAYRDAFQHGYDEGYNRYGYNDNRNNRNNRRYRNNGIADALRRIIIGY
jgi:hypothetical protein